MTKLSSEYFADWESDTFGFGYGSGEEYTIPALKTFMENTPREGGYDYKKLEGLLTPTVAWLLINILCHKDILEYGTSPRVGWLTNKGIRLRTFVINHTVDELYNFTDTDENYINCYPDACNCGPTGYQKGVICQNPFWLDDAMEVKDV